LEPVQLNNEKIPDPNHCVPPTTDFVLFPKDQVNQSIPSRFEQQVDKHPDRLAIKTAAGSVKYRDLNGIANSIAQAIFQSSQNPSHPVALISGRDICSIAAMLAVLKAGRILVPLDLERPWSFTRQILDNAGARLILATQAQLPAAKELAPQGVRVLSIDELQSGRSQENPGLAISSQAISWILYTSGTTGVPKGVMQTHRDELHNVMTITNSHYFSSTERMTLLRNPSVGGAIRNLFSALLNGASLFPYDVKKIGVAGLAEWLIQEEITVYHSSASLFRSFVRQLSGSAQFPNVRLVRLGSEPVMWSDVELFKSHFLPPCVMVNALSSTEARTYLHYFVDARTDIRAGVLPAGYPVDDTEVLILDDSDRPATPGEIGEMALRSLYVFPGYWKNKDESRDTVAPASMGQRLLHTGDMGRQLSDGSFEHLGRKDLLCKIRGYRVQIDLVEGQLQAMAEIERAVVVPQEWRGEHRLVAYIVTPNKQHFDPSRFRNFLQQNLPAFMIPAVFVRLDKMPTTPSGKIDRGALPLPGRQRPNIAIDLIPPSNAVERVLAELWANALDIEKVGIADNFLELGGHSLLAGEIVARINRIFALQLSPQALLESMTIANLARLLISQMPNASAEEMAQLWSEIDHMEPYQFREVLRQERTKPDNVR
jgi:acyl-coenzyme A synthetase/AMP-(fatty) acid ligase/acyl carrier protein